MSDSNTEPATAPKTVTLPATRAARAWDRATDALLKAAEEAERAAQASYEQAKSEYQAARQSAHMIRQLRAVARVEGDAAVALPPARQIARGKHRGRCAAPNPCDSCQRVLEAGA